MYKRQRRSTALLVLLPCLLTLTMASATIAAESSRSGVAPIGVGSLPGRLFEDGTVCLVTAHDASRCTKTLFKLPDEIVKTNVSVAISGKPYRRDNFFQVPAESGEDRKSGLAFYGIFDVDNDGDPEVFLDYWEPLDPPCPKGYPDNQDHGQCYALVVYKKVGVTYQIYLKLHAETQGYWPEAWFLAESPVRKAIFRTRYSGAGGGALFYLDFQKRALDVFAEAIWDDPVFGDVDGDGVAEILMKGRTYNDPADTVELFRWENGTYKLWPDWTPPYVYVVDAQLGAVETAPRKAIIAVLAPRDDELRRELGIWKFRTGTWTRSATAKLPDGKWVTASGVKASPQIVNVVRTHRGATIDLAYEDSTLTCVSRKGKATCPEPTKR